MLKKLALSLALVWGMAHAQTISLPGTTTTYQINDDGYANVPLPFSFNYYGKTFNNSWMYDNGVVSFLDPNSDGAVKPWQWNSPGSLSQSGGSYFIAPLWTDLAPTANSVYSTNTDGTYLRYNWTNVTEYYSRGTRLNSLSTTIKPDGSVATSYYSLNINQSNVIVGTVGDIAKGEINQLYQASAGTVVSNTSLQDWTYAGSAANACNVNALSSPECPGYSSALLKSLPSSSVTDTGIAKDTSVSSSEPTLFSATASTPGPASASADVLPRTNQTSNRSALALSIVAKNQQREQNTAMQAAQSAVSLATVSAASSQQESVTLSAGFVASSTTTSTTANRTTDSAATRENTNSSQVATTDRTNPLNEFVEPKLSVPATVSTTSKATVNSSTPDNSAAGGVDIAKMATAPAGYNSYLNFTLKDAAFYAPREVYQNQRTVDNVRALRQLSSDRTHREMIEQQYRR